MPYHEHSFEFQRGDLLALYTDGILEAQNDKGEDYTKDRLNELIVKNKDKPVDEILEVCKSDYEDFRTQDSDDITLVLLRKKV
jgi:sigma-B regulation protein RsbU (phosphoserine phosphatase)